ncbi:MAG: divergent PAP2 family protein [Lachnospiraceae bacterium]|nr:divergent PAP2 family protein [Lachnospiraceae bacterium]
MDFMIELFQNKIFVSAVIGWLVAQVLKTLIHFILTKKLVAERMVGSGGMPSSHSATVCALATATGIQYGGGGFEFAVTVMLAIIVMYDAMGVRRETGKQGQVLNEMLEVFTNMGKQISAEAKLKEFVGHTPLQVLMGAILGIAIAVIVMSI